MFVAYSPRSIACSWCLLRQLVRQRAAGQFGLHLERDQRVGELARGTLDAPVVVAEAVHRTPCQAID